MSIMPAGDLVYQFWVLTSCGMWVGHGWRSRATHSCGMWPPHFVFILIFFLAVVFETSAFGVLVPWCISPWPDISVHMLGMLLGTWPLGWTSHRPALGFGQDGKVTACPSWGRGAESLLLLLLVCGDRRVALEWSECPFCDVSCHPFHPHPPSGLLHPS